MMDVQVSFHHHQKKKSTPLGYLFAFGLLFAISVGALLGKLEILFLMLNSCSELLSESFKQGLLHWTCSEYTVVPVEKWDRYLRKNFSSRISVFIICDNQIF